MYFIDYKKISQDCPKAFSKLKADFYVVETAQFSGVQNQLVIGHFEDLSGCQEPEFLPSALLFNFFDSNNIFVGIIPFEESKSVWRFDFEINSNGYDANFEKRQEAENRAFETAFYMLESSL